MLVLLTGRFHTAWRAVHLAKQQLNDGVYRLIVPTQKSFFVGSYVNLGLFDSVLERPRPPRSRTFPGCPREGVFKIAPTAGR